MTYPGIDGEQPDVRFTLVPTSTSTATTTGSSKEI